MALRDVIPALNGFRRLNLLEAGHVLSGNALQLVLKVSGDGVAERIVEKLKKEVIAFRLRSDGFQFIPTTTDNLVVHRIPDGMSDVLEVDNWAVNEHPVISANRLGEISANERFVALNISHACSDGMYIAGIIDHILDPVKELTAVFPTPSDVVFAQEAAALKSFEFSNARETLLSLNRPRVGREKPLIRRVDATTLQCFDKKTGKCTGFSESMWASYILAVSSVLPTNKQFGLGVCVDMRKHLSPAMARAKDLSFCNLFCAVSVAAGDGWKDLSFGECCKRIRQDLQKQIYTNNAAVGWIKSLSQPRKPVPPGTTIIGSSHLGPIRIRKPIEDFAFTEVRYQMPFAHMLSLLSYSVVNETTGTNELVANIRYGHNGVTQKEAHTIMDTFIYNMTTLKPDMKISEVQRAITDFQAQRNLVEST